MDTMIESEDFGRLNGFYRVQEATRLLKILGGDDNPPMDCLDALRELVSLRERLNQVMPHLLLLAANESALSRNISRTHSVLLFIEDFRHKRILEKVKENTGEILE